MGRGTLRPAATHRGTELFLNPWLLMPAGPTVSNTGLQEGQGRCLDKEWREMEAKQDDLKLNSPGHPTRRMWYTATFTPTLRLEVWAMTPQTRI